MDERIFLTLHPWLLDLGGEASWRFITSKLFVAIVLGAASVWAHRHKQWRNLGIAVLCGLAGESLSSHVLKPLFAVPRPCLTEGLSQLARCSSTFAMPSSHAVSIVAGLVPLGYAWKAARPLLAVAAILFILSRLALGMHWPSDLLVGSLIGLSVGLVGIKAQNPHPVA